MPSNTVPNDEVGDFVQSLLDGPKKFGTSITVDPDYDANTSVVSWTWLPAEDAPAANARAAAPGVKSKKKPS